MPKTFWTGSSLERQSFTLLQETGQELLESVVAAGAVRADVSIVELLRLVNAIAVAAGNGGPGVIRLLSLVREGAMTRAEIAIVPGRTG